MAAFNKNLVINKKIVFIFIIFTISQHIKAQFPAIGTIDFYGLRTVSEKQIREKLPIKEGSEAPKSKAEKEVIEKRLQTIPNVEEAKLNFVCCTNDGKTMLYVGIREKGFPKIEFRRAPNSPIRLTDEIIKVGREFDAAHEKAILKGDIAEDRDAGHSLMKNAEARTGQQKFIPIANQNLKLLRKVLHESADAGHRALAAQVIAYYDDKSAIVADLIAAMKDSNGTVRNNAMRALGLIAGYAQTHPESKIKVPFEPFVEMLNSIEWSDRNKSALALEELTANRDPKLLKLLREKAVPSLVEMARWKNDGHAGTSFFIFGRVGGMTDDEIGRVWMTGNREDLIKKIENKIKTKS